MIKWLRERLERAMSQRCMFCNGKGVVVGYVVDPKFLQTGKCPRCDGTGVTR